MVIFEIHNTFCRKMIKKSIFGLFDGLSSRCFGHFLIIMWPFSGDNSLCGFYVLFTCRREIKKFRRNFMGYLKRVFCARFGVQSEILRFFLCSPLTLHDFASLSLSQDRLRLGNTQIFISFRIQNASICILSFVEIWYFAHLALSLSLKI